MDCQYGIRRRTAPFDEIEEAPQVKRFRDDVKDSQTTVAQPQNFPQQDQHQQLQQQQTQTAAVVQQPQQPTQTGPAPEQVPKFYISAPIQGYTTNSQGGCRYLFF
ncbi:unnamed protein product [Caenorhabditis bovis]|uniref:Uncharacterized protein n=1 Tax=Caenorhabditis bovis TaxID=2654633 RepID=A0A8S1E8S8_9PELO|nr:unnamed protein product [Caenorhabditis bovis]